MKFNFRMWTACCLLAAVAVGCEYDDTDLRNGLDDLEQRVTTLEEQVRALNNDMQNLTTITENLEKNVYVSDVSALSDGSGYQITFTNGTKAEIKNGTNGAAGKDGASIGINKDTDGVYYWTITNNGKTDWLTDSEGKKMPVVGQTPILGVDKDGFWTVSYDGGKTSTRITDAEGENVKALQDSGLFSDVTYTDDMVTVTLADGTELQLPRTGTFGVVIKDAAETEEFTFGQTKTYALEINGVEEIVINKPDEWRANVSGETLTVTAPDASHADCAELEGAIKLLCINAAGLTKLTSLAVAIAAPEEEVAYEFTIPTDFSDCYIQRVVVNGKKIAEICFEYINSIDDQLTVVYPMAEDGTPDLTQGLDATTGGKVVWNTTSNTCTYTAGNSVPVTKLYYIPSTQSLAMTTDLAVKSADVEADLISDTRNGDTQTYKITKIGTQYWMAESLRAESYTDGTPISTDWSNTNGAYIYLSNDRASYRTLYGTLYSGYAVMENADILAPEGWTLPEGDDINALRTYLGDTPGTKLKSTTGWTGSYPGNNITGFNALPGQYYAPIQGDDFGSTTPDVLFWTKTSGKDVLSRDLSLFYYRLYNTNTRLTCETNVNALAPSLHAQSFGHYIRCIRK